MSTRERINAIKSRLLHSSCGNWTAELTRVYSDQEGLIADCGPMFGDADAELIANAPADLAWLLDQLEAAQARAAAAEARLERARVPFRLLRGVQVWNAKTGEVDVVGFDESYPQTPAHDAISDDVAARFLDCE